MAPKLSLAEQKKKLKEKEQRAKDNEKREKEKERGDRKAQEQRDKMFGLKNKSKGKAAAGALDEAERTLKAMPGSSRKRRRRRGRTPGVRRLNSRLSKRWRKCCESPSSSPRCRRVDPKTIVCEHFKQNVCKLGDECKFSHQWVPKADKTAQLKEMEIHTGAVTKSGAKSKAQLEKEAAEKEAAERKAAAAKNSQRRCVEPHSRLIPSTSTTKAWTSTNSSI